MAGFDFLLGGPDANSDQSNAARMGLLAAGLGMLANNTGHYGAAGPAIGAGGLTGLQGYQGALDQQAQDRANAFKLEQQQAAMNAARAKQSYVSSIASGQRQFNPNEALAAGLSMDDIKGMSDFGNLGKPKVKEYREIRLPDGRVVSQGYDEYGQAVGEGQTPYKAPLMTDLGGRVVALDPTNLSQLGGFGKTMTPGEAASNAVARGNLGVAQQRLAFDMSGPGNNPMTKGAPSGYRWNMQGGLEAIPGGPAEAGKAPTEFQGKSASFGARAEAADKILSDLTGKYSPAAVATKQGMEAVPLVGGILGAGANKVLSPQNQMAEQSMRDFINATLRQESGASISPAEFENARKQYFPQPGDTADVIAQKARNRQTVIQGFKVNAGKAAYSASDSKPAGGGWSAKRID